MPPVPPPAASRRLVALVAAVLLVDTAFFAAITPLIPYEVVRLHISAAVAGLLVAGYPAGTFVLALPAGVLAARMGARAAVRTGVVLTGIATVAFGWATSVPVLVAARVVEGAAGSLSWAGALAWLALAVPTNRRARAIGRAFGAAAAGSLGGPLVGGLATIVGPGPAFSTAGVSAAALAFLTVRIPPPAPETMAGGSRLLQAARDRRLVGGLALVALAGTCFGVVDVLGPLRMHRLGAGPLAVAAVFLAAAALEAMGSPWVGRLADRYGRRAPLRASLAVSVVVALLCPTVRPAVVLGVVLALGVPIFGALYTPATALVADGAERTAVPQGLAAATLNLVWAVGATGAAAGSGAIAGVTGQLVPWAALAGMCGLFFVVLRRRPAGVQSKT
jgi:predicted MFS family arabinose efflux permease